MSENQYTPINKFDDSEKEIDQLSQFLNTSNERIPLIDRILNKNGYNSHVLMDIFIFFLFTLVQGYVLNIFSILLIPYKNFLNFSDSISELISAFVFLGTSMGSICSGYLSKADRIFTVKFSMILICLFQLLTGFSDNIHLICVLRFIIGILNGIIASISGSWIVEVLPTYFRSFVICTCWIGFSVGIIIPLLIMLILMPNLEKDKLNITVIASCGLLIISTIIILIYFRDSPRSLIVRGEYNEAFEILEKLHGSNIPNEVRQKIIFETCSGTNKEQRGDFSELFQSDYLKITLLIGFICFSTLMFWGPSFISSITLKSLGQFVEKTNNQVIIDELFIHSLLFIAHFFTGVITEIKYLGRKNSMILGLILSCMFILLACFIPTKFALFFGIFMSFINAPFSVITVYCSEVYPTKLRDFANAFASFSSRMGAVFSQFIYMRFSNLHIFLPYYFTAFLCSLNILLVYFLPYETLGRPLDVDLSDDERTDAPNRI